MMGRRAAPSLPERPSADCLARLETLSACLDGDISAARRRALERHLSDCTCCAYLGRRLERTVRVCREAGLHTLPSDVQRRARARIKALLDGRGRARHQPHQAP